MPFLFWMPFIVMCGMFSVAHDQADIWSHERP
jgi:hypothetical protein